MQITHRYHITIRMIIVCVIIHFWMIVIITIGYIIMFKFVHCWITNWILMWMIK